MAGSALWPTGTGAEAAQSPANARTGKDSIIAGLKAFLSRKEGELVQLVAVRKKKLKEADALAKQVEEQKERGDLGWFERRAVEKDLARLRTQFEDIERVTVKERAVREESFACAAAIVAELETSLERQLADIKRQRMSASLFDSESRREIQSGRQQRIERVRALEKSRGIYQRRMNALMPRIQVPGELPTDVPWSKEMIEDQRRSYEASIARFQSERELLLQERRLRRSLADVLPEVPKNGRAASEKRIEKRIREYDRKIEIYKDKLDRMPSDSGRAGS